MNVVVLLTCNLWLMLVASDLTSTWLVETGVNRT